MDTILLVVGVVGLSISGWVLRGYFINTPTVSTLDNERISDDSNSEPEKPVKYITTEEHDLVLARIAELEKVGFSTKNEEKAIDNNSESTRQESVVGGSKTENKAEENNKSGEPELSDAWKEIYALQQVYKQERDKESEIDYEREQVLFDLSEGYDRNSLEYSRESDQSEEDRMSQRLLDNQFEDGEDLGVYQERLHKIATLSREVLILRLDEADRQIREQQERHQADLLAIISSLIERMPGDVNLKSVVQSSYIAASNEISDEKGEPNRESFAEMFLKHVGR